MNNKKILKIIWGANFVSKPVYLYIAWTQYNSGIALTSGFPVIALVFLGLGAIAAIGGLFIVGDLSKTNPTIQPFYIKMMEKSRDSYYSDPVAGQYIMGLGLEETAAVFGLVSFILTGSAVPSLILLGIWFTAWIFSRPPVQVL